MAEGIASNLVTGVLGKLGSALWDEIGLLRSFKDDVKALERKLLMIQAVLRNAEERSSAGKENDALHIWLSELKGAAYDIDDLLEEIQTQVDLRKQRHEVQNQKQLAKKVREFLSRANPMHQKFKVKMAHRMKALRKKIDNIAIEMLKFRLVEAGSGQQAEFNRPDTFSIVDEKKIVGRNDDKEKIVKLLLETDSETFSVIPIVGLGGLGKTTLAQLAFNDKRVTVHPKNKEPDTFPQPAFNDERVTGHPKNKEPDTFLQRAINDKQRFDLLVWVCASTDFDVKKIAEAVISAAGQKCDDRDNMDTVARRLVAIYSQKRFLLVLDDVWNEDQDKWGKLKDLFKDGMKGSKVLVTTRSEKVAEIMKTVEPHRVKGLSVD